jgi:O-acetyl-ADP-ribose deacetylase (regulator of RNase III)
MEIEVLNLDTTKLEVDAIVNAANTSLLGGGGVDGAIHRAGGAEILKECIKIRNKQGGCKTGEAVITTAGNLYAKYVIHTVGPVWSGNKEEKKILLHKCYVSSLELASNYNLKTIAFPNISTGIYKFPKQIAVEIAFDAVFNSDHIHKFNKIMFVCFDTENFDLYEQKLKTFNF